MIVMSRLVAHIRLARPANILTAIADILLGYAASGSVVNFFSDDRFEIAMVNLDKLPWLMLSTIGLYGGGVVMNDVFDAELDKVERPERPIPSGHASIRSGMLMGCSLLLLGVWSAAQVSLTSALIAFSVAFLAILYDSYGKHHRVLGPINMGACRGGNLLLGMSIISFGWMSYALALVPVIYINAITIISCGEVTGGNPRNLILGFISYGIVVLAILTLVYSNNADLMQTAPFLLLFVFLIFPPVVRAIRQPSPTNIGKAVKMGVLSLIVMDATIAVGFAGWAYGLLILLLLPLSLQLSKSFAVT